jgi:hypothetical protein
MEGERGQPVALKRDELHSGVRAKRVSIGRKRKRWRIKGRGARGSREASRASSATSFPLGYERAEEERGGKRTCREAALCACVTKNNNTLISNWCEANIIKEENKCSSTS